MRNSTENNKKVCYIKITIHVIVCSCLPNQSQFETDGIRLWKRNQFKRMNTYEADENLSTATNRKISYRPALVPWRKYIENFSLIFIT